MSFDTPSGPPPSGPPETLDFGGGEPLPRDRGGRRAVVLVVGAVAAVAVAGASWAAFSFFSTGPQPAEALPGSTIAYVSVDLDPSGGQKIEALRTLSKFPAFEEHVGLDTDDDIREWIFDRVQGDCDDLDYADDVEPWLGDRFGLAAVDVGGDVPAAVFVLQVSDEDGADQGLQAIKECNDAAPDEGAWAIRDGWLLLAETEKIAGQVADATEKGSLADDGDYQRWTDEVGDSGVVTMYAAPEAGELLAQDLLPTHSYGESCTTDEAGNELCEELSPTDTIPVPPEMDEATEALEEFRGGAATIRFDDGGLELEVAADSTALGSGLTGGDDAGEVAGSLPDDTIAALAVSFGEGWVDDLLEQVAETDGGSVGDLVDEVTETLGIDLPADAEALVGDALAVAIGPGFDPAALDSGSTDLPGVGVKIIGDADDIDAVLDKLRTAAAGADEGVLDSDAGDGAVTVGPDADYRAELLEDGDLGGTDAYRRVIEHADDAAAILFVDLDAGDDWVAELAGDDQEVRENLEPLDAFGISAWRDDETAHTVLKITSD